jgi:hypothetical protein
MKIPRLAASACSGAVIGPGMAQHASAIQSLLRMPCGGPCIANSGRTTRSGGVSEASACSISAQATSLFLEIVSHAASGVAASQARTLGIWMQVARQGCTCFGPYFGKGVLVLKKKNQKDFYVLPAQTRCFEHDLRAGAKNKSLLVLFFRKEHTFYPA